MKTQRYFYAIEFENLGGLISPIILEITYEGGRSETLHIPAEIWRYDSRRASRLLLAKSQIERIVLDPHHETADAETNNNHWPARPIESRFQLFKRKKEPNPLQEAQKAKNADAAESPENEARDE